MRGEHTLQSTVMPRFVILHHVVPAGAPRPSHCDLMLESGDVLRTWSLTQLPRDWATLDPENHIDFSEENEVEAIQLADHRKSYLDYEGPVSGDRGHVRRLEAGEYDLNSESPETVIATLAGQIIRGQIAIRRTRATHYLTFQPNDPGCTP
jgi:hypothetical protein